MATAQAESESQGGELVITGATDWANVGKSDSKKKGNKAEAAASPLPTLTEPHRIRGLQGVSISFVAAGCASCHCMAIDTSGQVYTWGRNEFGQLGHGDTAGRSNPTIVEALKGSKAIWAASGRHHSVVVMEDGKSFSWGQNKHGQLGIGQFKTEMEASPQAVKGISDALTVACGAEFTAWIVKGAEGGAAPEAGAGAGAEGTEPKTPANILTAGLPQYGQLGHGTDNQYNAKEGTVKIVFEPQPTPKKVAALAGRTIVKVACGNNHTVAVDSEGFLYTWGFGGHGRLGHREQKDEFRPRRVDIFLRTNILPPNAVVAAGTAFSACTAGGGQPYMWGRVKPTGDAWMYPKPLMDLSGWNIRSMDSGSTISCVAADNSCISWGLATYGELGYGALGPKSSANPKKVESLENFHTLQVACGMANIMAILRRDKWQGKAESSQAHLDKLPVWDPPEDAAAPAAATAGKGKGGKAKESKAASPAAAPKAGKAAKAAPAKKKAAPPPEEEDEEEEEEPEEEEEEEDEEDDSDDGKGKSKKRKPAGKKSPAARKKPTKAAAAAPAAQPSRRSGRSRK